MILRPIKESDVAGVVAVDHTTDGSWSERQWRSELRLPESFQLVADDCGRIVAYITFRLVEPECELLRLGTLPLYRRQGIAGKLMIKAFEHLIKQKIRCCFLEVRESNTIAINLYTGYGFRTIGLRPGYYQDTGEDAVLMRKDFSH